MDVSKVWRLRLREARSLLNIDSNSGLVMSTALSPTMTTTLSLVRHEATTLSIANMVRGAAQRRLSNSGYANPLRHINIQFAHGHLTLDGIVSCYYHKQIAQELLRNLEHVGQIRNELEVHWPD